MVRRVAYLNNHNSAASFVASACLANGVEFYMPSRCNEPGSLRNKDARRIRTVSLDPLTIDELDRQDLYSNRTRLSRRYIQALSENFNLVILAGAVRTKPLLQIAKKVQTQVVVLEWGDIGGLVFHTEFKQFERRSNIEIAVAYEEFSADKRHLPLGLNPAVSSTVPIPKFNMCPTAAIVVSRLGETYSSNRLLNVLQSSGSKDYRNDFRKGSWRHPAL